MALNDVVFLKQYELLANSTVEINVQNRLPAPEKYFYYLQVHAHLHEVELQWSTNDNNNSSDNRTSDRGSNLGHIFFIETSSPTDPNRNRTLVLLNDDEQKTVSIIIVLLVYEIDKTPIPGGKCSQLESDIAKPNLNTSTLEDMIRATFAPGTLPSDRTCKSPLSSADYEFRYIYFGKNEYSARLYFDSIKRLLVATKAVQVGDVFSGKINAENTFSRVFARYAGMGLFFVAILRDTGNETFVPISYVPSASYGCPGPVTGTVHCDLIGKYFHLGRSVIDKE